MSYQQGYEDGVRFTKAEFLVLHKEEIELQDELLGALIKAKELLEQATEIYFDDMTHIAITSEDECDMRELIDAVIAKAMGEE